MANLVYSLIHTLLLVRALHNASCQHAGQVDSIQQQAFFLCAKNTPCIWQLPTGLADHPLMCIGGLMHSSTASVIAEPHGDHAGLEMCTYCLQRLLDAAGIAYNRCVGGEVSKWNKKVK